MRAKRTTAPGAWAPMQTTQGERERRFSVSNYTPRPSPRNCRACGQHCRSDVCGTCRAWIRVHQHHVAMSVALRGVS